MRKSVKTKLNSETKIRPAITPEARENQMISLAIDLAERQLIEGTASAQVITHYLKLGTTKERLEKEKLEKENELLKAKTVSIQSQGELKDLYAQVVAEMKRYRGESDDEEYHYDSDVY